MQCCASAFVVNKCSCDCCDMATLYSVPIWGELTSFSVAEARILKCGVSWGNDLTICQGCPLGSFVVLEIGLGLETDVLDWIFPPDQLTPQFMPVLKSWFKSIYTRQMKQV